MKLLDEIIDLLSSKDGNLTDALLKTKILLHKLGHKELVDWVNFELNGYPPKGDVPSYRKLHAEVRAHIASFTWHMASSPLPLSHLDSDKREWLETAVINQSLAVVEGWAAKGSDSHLQRSIPLEFNGILGKQLDSGVEIVRAWSQIDKSQIPSILIQVRSRLLDFALTLRDQLPTDMSDSETKQQAEGIDTRGIFNNAIFGPNATVIVGDHNVQTATNTIVKGDFNSLASALRQKKVSEEDIQSLRTAIDADGPDVAANKGQFGPGVKAWMERMWSKAVELSWQIELNVAGSLLATALCQYYGWR